MNINRTILSIQDDDKFLKFIDIFKSKLTYSLSINNSQLKHSIYYPFEIGYWFNFKLNKLANKTLSELSADDYLEYVKLKSDKNFFVEFFKKYVFMFCPYSAIDTEWRCWRAGNDTTEDFIFHFLIIHILRKHKN